MGVGQTPDGRAGPSEVRVWAKTCSPWVANPSPVLPDSNGAPLGSRAGPPAQGLQRPRGWGRTLLPLKKRLFYKILC